jgi:tRNA dimethylallyltransferase
VNPGSAGSIPAPAARPLLRVLCGPTASGKESVALHLAPLLDAEILVLDSMKVYRGMDVGTSKVPPAVRGTIPHHLLDVADPGESMSVSRFLSLADEAAAAIAARGRSVLAVGGTTLYLKALLFGLFEGPAADLPLRARLEAEGAEALHARLKAADPASAARIHPTDLRRLVRALEVLEKTGRPISEQQVEWKTLLPRYPHRLLALRRPRADLHARIAARVKAMDGEGLVEEVRRLRAAPGGLGRTASQAIGYKEIADFLDGRVASREEALEKVRTRTNRLARAQETWLRSFPGMEFLDVPAGESAETTARRAAERLR